MLMAPHKIKSARRGVELAELRRLGVHLTVVTQVQLAMRQYKDAIDADYWSGKQCLVDTEMRDLTAGIGKTEAGNLWREVAADAQAVVSMMEHYKDRAEVHNAYGRVLSSMGIDFVPELSADMGFIEIRDALKRHDEVRRRELRDVTADALHRIRSERNAEEARQNDGVRKERW